MLKREDFTRVSVDIPVMEQIVYVSNEDESDLENISMQVIGFKCNPWSDGEDLECLLIGESEDIEEDYYKDCFIYSSKEVAFMEEEAREEYLSKEDNLDCWVKTKKVDFQIIEVNTPVLFKKYNDIFDDEFNIEEGTIAFENVILEYDYTQDILKSQYLIDRPVGKSVWVSLEDIIL